MQRAPAAQRRISGVFQGESVESARHVWQSELCEDVYQRDYPAGGADESAAGGGNSRVMRGGSWLDPPDLYRMAKRFAFAPHGRRDFLGFRVVMKVKR